MKQFDSKAMIQSPARWPLWPLLPVKKRGSGVTQIGFPPMGILVDDNTKRGLTIYIDASPFGDPFPLDQYKQVKYDSAEAMVADGWVVD